MKKSKNIILAAAIIMSSMLITSCTSNSSNSKEDNSSQVNSNIDNENNSSEDSETEGFYGKWTISKLIKQGKVSALSDEDINALIGNTIKFSSSKITYKDNTYTNPVYNIKEINNDELRDSTFMTFEDLNIKGTKVQEIQLDKYDNMNELANTDKDLPGFYLLCTEDNSLIFVTDGDYFELLQDK